MKLSEVERMCRRNDWYGFQIGSCHNIDAKCAQKYGLEKPDPRDYVWNWMIQEPLVTCEGGKKKELRVAPAY